MAGLSPNASRLPATLFSRVGLGLLVVVAVTLLRLAAGVVLADQAPFLFHVAGVAVATWVAGREGGITAALLGSVLVPYLFIPPYEGFVFQSSQHVAGMVLFVAVSFGLVWQVGRWRLAEQALSTSEERWRRLVEVSAQMVWTTGPDGKAVEDSPSWREFTGLPYEQWVGANWLGAVHPDDRDRLAQTWEEAVANRSVYAPEFRMRHHSGGYRTVQCRAVPLLNPDGSVREWIGMNVDISERKAAEEALRQSQAQLAALMDATVESIWLFDADGKVLACNRPAAARFGKTPADLLGTRAWDALPPRVAATRRLKHQEVMTTGQPVTFEDERAGILFEHRYYPILDANGGVSAVASYSRDVTVHRRAELAIKESREDLNHAQAIAHVGSWRLDVRKDELRWSDETYRIFGIPIGTAMTYETFLEVIHPDDREMVDLAWKAALGGAPYDLEHRLVVDGQIKWVHERGALEVGEDGKLIGGFGSVQDITERVGMEEERSRTVARVHALLEMSEALSAAATPEEITTIILERSLPAMGAYAGTLALLNEDRQAMEVVAAWGYPPGMVAAPAVYPMFPPSPMSDAIRTGKTVTVASREEWRARYPEAYREWSRTQALAAVPVRGERVVGALGLSFLSAHDLDTRDRAFIALVAKQAAQALERSELLVSERRARAQAEEASRLKDEFLATLSHELRTPLHAILGWSQMLMTDRLDPDARKRALAVISRNASVQARLVEDVLELSRIVKGSLTLNLDAFDVPTIVERAVDSVRPAADAKGIAIELDLCPASIVGDAERVQQVMWNLLSNAVKFTEGSGRIRVASRISGKQVEIAVADTGVGISPAFLPHVFERFTQSDTSRTRRYGGLGLGLAIVRHIVELHGGTVAASSEGDGQGSVFTVRLPIHRSARPDRWDAPGEPVPAAPASEAKPVPSLAGVRIVVVEDDGDAREILGKVLEAAGATVTLAATAEEGLQALTAAPATLLISDIGLPDEDGYALMRKVRENGHPLRGMPALALTGYGDARDRRAALEAGYDEYLAKPVSPDDLLAVVARVVEKGRV